MYMERKKNIALQYGGRICRIALAKLILNQIIFSDLGLEKA